MASNRVLWGVWQVDRSRPASHGAGRNGDRLLPIGDA